MPKISVIVPVYNTEKYIQKCLESIVNQTMKDIEIIVVNDGSKDKSEDIIEQFIKNNKSNIKIKYYKKKNGGLSDARNYGVQKATGEYIAFVDSDDYIKKGLYKELEKYIDKKIDLIKFKIETVNETGKTIKKLDGPIFEEKSGEEAFKILCTTDKFLEVACTYLYRREFYINNKFKYRVGTYHEDFGLTPLIIVQAKIVVSTNTYGYCYLQRENSITSIENEEKETKKAYDVLKHYDNAISKLNNININNETKLLVKRYYTNTLLLKALGLKGREKEEYIMQIKQRKVYRNIKAENFRQLVKKIILMISVKLYLKIR